MRTNKELFEEMLDLYLKIHSGFKNEGYVSLCGVKDKMQRDKLISDEEDDLIYHYINRDLFKGFVFLDESMKEDMEYENNLDYRIIFRIEWLLHQIEIYS